MKFTIAQVTALLLSLGYVPACTIHPSPEMEDKQGADSANQQEADDSEDGSNSQQQSDMGDETEDSGRSEASKESGAPEESDETKEEADSELDPDEEGATGESEEEGEADAGEQQSEESASDAGAPTPSDGPQTELTAPDEYVPPTCEEEEALGDTSTDLTLAAGTCYRVEGTMTVSGGTLTIEPGVVILFDTNAAMEVIEDGAIVAEGTPDERITFKGSIEEAGHWRSLDIMTNNPSNSLNYVQFAHGGSEARCCSSGRGAATVLLGSEARASIKNSVFALSAGNGLEVEADAKLDAFESNLFTENEAASVRIAADLVRRLDSGSDYAGSNETGEAHISVRGSGVSTDASWPPANVPFRAETDITVTAELTLPAGLTLQFGSGDGLSVVGDGVLRALGTENSHVEISGRRGDQRGTFLGVLIDSAGDNQLTYVDVIRGGEDDFCCVSGRSVAGLVMAADARASIEDSSFVSSGAYGMYITSTATLAPFARNRFSDNGAAALQLHASEVTLLDSASVYGEDNEDNRVEVRGNTISRDGTWPAIDVPYLVLQAVTVDSALEIEDGAHISFDAETGIWVGIEGSLSATSEDQSTLFDGRVDQDGYWEGLAFSSPSESNLLDGVLIDGAGSGAWCCDSSFAAAAVLVDTSSQVTVRNSEISRSGGWGIFAVSDALGLTEADNSFTDNSSGNVRPLE